LYTIESVILAPIALPRTATRFTTHELLFLRVPTQHEPG